MRLMKPVLKLGLVMLILSPLAFSITFSRIYGANYFLFFTQPTADDEGYFDHLNVWFGDSVYSPTPASNCHIPQNYRGIGSALLWTPGYLLFKVGGSWLQNVLGLSVWDQGSWLRLGAASANYLIAAAILLLAYLILGNYVSQTTQWVFSFVIAFGSLLPYYLFRRPLMSHAAEAFYFSLAVYGIERMKSNPAVLWHAFCTGMALAGLLSTRFQLLPVVGVMFLALAYEWRADLRRLGVIGLTFLIAMLPQMWINKQSFGHWITPPSFVRPFLTPLYLLQIGPIQAVRVVHLFFGKDWGLLWMFPWLLFGLFAQRKQVLRLWHRGKVWLVGSLPTILMWANFKAHGASYGQRYVSLFLFSMTFVAALGVDRLIQRARWRKWVWTAFGIGLFISLLHFTAFESDPRDLTLRVDKIMVEGPSKKEWETLDNEDWVNGEYSRNVYALFLHPRHLVQTFGAAPIPLTFAHRNSAVQAYLEKHDIRLRMYWRYAALIFILELLVLAGLQMFLIFRARTKSLSPGLM